MTQKKIVISVLIIIFLFLAGFVIFLLTKPRVVEKPQPKEIPTDVLKSLTAPAGSEIEVPEAVIKSLTAPEGKPKAVPQNVLDSLTAPEK